MIAALEIVLLAVLAYAWVGYPIALGIVARRRKARPARLAERPAALPGTVSFLFSSYNEEENMAARIANLLHAIEELRPSGVRCEILAGVDGSDDRTAEIVRTLAGGHAEIRVFESRERRGKMRMVKDLVAAAGSEVLVLTDANTSFRPGSIAKLLGRFADPAVGGVCGRLVLKESGARSPESSYWDWESHLKLLESDLGSCLGANGAIYAIRRELFWRDVPDNTVVDDFVIGMKVREGGRRMVYEPAAVAEEDLPELAYEWRRRVRIGAGDFQAMVLCARCLLPGYGSFAWAFWSHKVLRWFTPHVMIAAVLLAGFQFSILNFQFSILHPAVAVLAGCLTGLLAWGAVRMARVAHWDRRGWVPLLLLWEHFVTMQVALFVGSLRYLRGDLKGHWPRTPRGGAGH